MTIAALGLPIKIAEAAWKDATQFYWFDCRNTKDIHGPSSRDWLREAHLPFDNCAIVWPLKEGHDIVLFLRNQANGVGVFTAMTFPDGDHVPFPPFVYRVIGDNVEMRLSKDTHEAKVNAKNVFIVINKWFEMLTQGGEAYEITVPKSSINRRRIAKGKRPLYDWRTVVISPSKAKTAPQGGTHAPPRQHDRRGHLRRLKSGRTVWVRQTKVGKASDGFVFHDYVVA